MTLRRNAKSGRWCCSIFWLNYDVAFSLALRELVVEYLFLAPLKFFAFLHLVPLAVCSAVTIASLIFSSSHTRKKKRKKKKEKSIFYVVSLFIGLFWIQGVLYGSVGFGCGLVGQGIANLIMTAKRYYFLSTPLIPQNFLGGFCC